MMPLWFSIALSIASLVGGLVNARGRVEGFYIWMLTSGLWGALCILEPSMLGQLPMWVAYFGISTYGVRRWKKNASSVPQGQSARYSPRLGEYGPGRAR